MLSPELWQLLLNIIIIVLVIVLALVIVGILAVIVFWRTGKMTIPRIMLFALGILEKPAKSIFKFFKQNPLKVEYLAISIKNNLYRPAYAQVPYKDRAIFIPQCLRSPECPARLSPEGIQCINCGRCGLGEVKKFAEDLGCKVFIAPGSSLIGRMIKKYKPKAVVGVGCVMEVREGLDLVGDLGIPVQGVLLDRSGCVDTRVNVGRLMEVIALDPTKTGISASIHETIRSTKEGIQSKWAQDECPKSTNLKKK